LLLKRFSDFLGCGLYGLDEGCLLLVGEVLDVEFCEDFFGLVGV
jgi:hypothetical protein